MQDTVIALRDVSKFYRLYTSPQDRLKEALNPFGKTYHKKFYAIRNLNLEIRRGEIVGIVGRNGSGKSTLLKLISGVLTPDEGSVKVRGNISALLELGSGFNPEFTGMQNIFFYGTILGFTRKQMEKKLDDILAFADIGAFIHQPLKTYSSGMKSRLGFAVAVHIDPKILILDEVLAVGDVLFRRKCFAKMDEFFKGGKTIIFVSHDGNSVRELCTRAVLLDGGKILLDSDAKTVTNYYEKLLFAKGTNQADVKNEIEELSSGKRETLVADVSEENKEKRKNIPPARKGVAEEKAFYIPDFRPESTVEFKNDDVRIINPHIVTVDGTEVNVLVQGEEYECRYRVKFGIMAENVSFAMQIKSAKGVSISGASLTSFKNEIAKVEAGTELDVTWSFQCQLLPSTYFVNVGSSCELHGKRVVLHRIVDALCFKVISRHPERYWGSVTLGQYPTVIKITE